MNLESLRRKRVKRMGIKNRMPTGQRRIFLVLERGTRKFHGDVGLWMQYLEFARKQKSTKKISEILTSMLRLHPTRSELWIHAANYALEVIEDMAEARSYMQRGLRFCKNSKNLWIEYAKLEMIYIAKISARARALGRNEELSKKDLMLDADVVDGNTIALPKMNTFDVTPNDEGEEIVEQEIIKLIEASPALSGAIPMAIFDRAMTLFDGDTYLGEQFFDVIMTFQEVSCANNVLQHIVDHLVAAARTDPSTLICYVRQPLAGLQILSPDFPGALGIALRRLNTGIAAMSGPQQSLQHRLALSQKAIEWILQFLVEGLDSDVYQVILITLHKLWAKYQADTQKDSGNNTGDGLFRLIGKLQERGLEDMVNTARQLAVQLWPGNPKMKALQGIEA